MKCPVVDTGEFVPIMIDPTLDREAQERSMIAGIKCTYCVEDTITDNLLLVYGGDLINPFDEWRVPALQTALSKAQMKNKNLIVALQRSEIMLRLSLEGGGSIHGSKLGEL